MLSKTKFSVLDLETTGLDIKKDGIVSIAIIPMIGTKILVGKYYYRFVKPRKIDAKSIKIHGIDLSTIKNANTFEEISEEIDEILKDTILVGCNTGFDVGILENHFSRNNMKIKFDWVDVIQIEKWLFEKSGMRRDFKTLEQLVERYGMENEYRHSALADAYQSAQVFQFQLKKLLEFKIGIKDLLNIGRRRQEFTPFMSYGMG